MLNEIALLLPCTVKANYMAENICLVQKKKSSVKTAYLSRPSSPAYSLGSKIHFRHVANPFHSSTSIPYFIIFIVLHSRYRPNKKKLYFCKAIMKVMLSDQNAALSSQQMPPHLPENQPDRYTADNPDARMLLP